MYSMENGGEGTPEPSREMKVFLEAIPDGGTAIDDRGVLWERTGDRVSSVAMTGGAREEFDVPVVGIEAHGVQVPQESPTKEQLARREAKREAREDKRSDRNEYLEKFTRMRSKDLRTESSQAATEVSIAAVESTGVSHEEAVHAVAVEVAEAAEVMHEDNTGAHPPLRELPAEAASEAIVASEIEAVGSLAKAERSEAVSRVFAMNRELRQVESMLTAGASDTDLSRLKQAAAKLRGDMFNLIKSATPEVYEAFKTKNPDLVGDKKERSAVIREFFATKREHGVRSQAMADRIFSDAQEVYTETLNESVVSPEMQQAEAVIETAVASDTPKEDKTDTQVAADFVKDGVVPDDASPMLDVDASGAKKTRVYSSATEVAKQMQQEMDALAETKRDEHHLEMGGSVPIDDGEETTHMAAHPHTTHGFDNVMEAYGEGMVNPELASGFASFMNNRPAPRAEQARVTGDWSNPDTWSLVPKEDAPAKRALPEQDAQLDADVLEAFGGTAKPGAQEAQTSASTEVAPGGPRRPEGIGADIKQRFESSLGIKAEVLESDPSFKKLTHEQQLLVLRDVANFSVDNLNDQVKSDIEREWEGQGRVSRVASTAKKIITFGLLGTKGVLTARKKREQEAQFAAAGFGEAAKSRQEFLREIASKRLEQDPSISLEANGALRVNMISPERASTPESREALMRYNEAASLWSKVPEHIRQLGAADLNGSEEQGLASRLFSKRIAGLTPAEQMQYEAARNSFEEAEGGLAKALLSERAASVEESTREKMVSQELLAYRERIATEQFMNGHPNAEAMLLAMENPPTWTESLGNMLRAAPTYMAYGALARAGAVAVLSTVGAPVVAATLMAGAGIAGYRARKTEIAKAQTLLKERRAAGARSEEDLREKVEITIDYAANLSRKQAELRDAVMAQDGYRIGELQREVREAELRVEEHGAKVRVKREIREFRDAKHYSRYIESMIARRDSVAEAAEAGDAEAAKRLELIDHKLATASKRMRTLKDQGMINYKRGYAGVAGHIQGYADFAEALARADTAVSIDDAALDQHIEESLALRRSVLDEAAQKRMRNEIRKGVYSRVAYSVAGWFIGAELFHGGVAEANAATQQVAPKASAGQVPGVKLPEEILAPARAADQKAALEWANASPEEKLQIQKVTGMSPEQLQYEAQIAEFAALAKSGAEGVSKPTVAPVEAVASRASTSSVSVPKDETVFEKLVEKVMAPEKTQVVSGNVHEVKSGENLLGVMGKSAALAGMSGRASEIALADFLKFATPEQLKEIGVTSGNPNVLAAGDHINMGKVDDMLRTMTYRGTPLLDHAKRLAEVNPTASHEAVGAGASWSSKTEELMQRMMGGQPTSGIAVPKDEVGLDSLTSRLSGGSEPVSGVGISKDEAGFESLIASKGGVSPEVSRQVKADVENVFSNFADNGERMRGLRAEDVIHKNSPYRWSSVSMNQEYNATQAWLRNIALQTHTSPTPGQTVDQYVTEVFTKIHSGQVGGAAEAARATVAEARTGTAQIAQEAAATSKEAVKLSPEITSKINESVARTYWAYPNAGRDMQGMPAILITNDTAPYWFKDPEMVREFNAMKAQLQDLSVRSNVIPQPGVTVDEYLNQAYAKIYAGGGVLESAKSAVEIVPSHMTEAGPRDWSLPGGGHIKLRGITFFQNASGIRPHIEASLTGVDTQTYFDSSKFVPGARDVKGMEVTAGEEISTLLKYAAAYEQINAHGSPAEAAVLLDFLQSESAKMIKHYGAEAIKTDKLPSYMFAAK
jgi:hypothetical protein